MWEKIRKDDPDGVMYDAFISYRHIEPDASIAEKIHQKLERYHIPKKIRESSSKKKISRIFRDKEELPLSSNLTEDIYEALDNSEFLVLICSPESMASIWVQRELEYFLEKHDQEHVIAVLVSGEPKESFPDVICRKIKTISDIYGEMHTVTVPVEPLAADVRGKNKKESLKKLNVEMLRLLACMLRCPYDSLKQRHKEYIIKRTTFIASVVVIALGIFGMYAYSQSKQIQAEHEASLLYMKESVQNQARNLAQQSLDALAEGNREEAINKALTVDLEKMEDRAVDEAIVPEQMYALNSVLYSYRDGQHISFRPECTADIQDIKNGCFSADGTWYYAWNESDEGYIFSGEDGKLLWKIDTSEVEEQLTESSSGIVMLIPYGKNSVIVVMVHAVAVLNARTHEFVKILPVETNLVNISSYDLEGNLLMLNTDRIMCLCDVERGEILRFTDIYGIIGYQNKGDYAYLEVENVDIAGDGTRVVCAVSCSENPNNEMTGLFVYNLTTGESKPLSMMQATDVRYIDDTHIVAIHKETPTLQKEGGDEHAYYKYFLAVYDITSGEILYTGEKMQILESYYTGIEVMNLTEGDEEFCAVVYWIDNDVSVINLDTYEFYGTVVMDDSVLNVSKFNDNSFLIGSENGWIQRIVLSDMILRYDCMNLSVTLSSVEYNEVTNKLVVLKDEKVVFCSNVVDDDMTAVVCEDFSGTVRDIEYYEAGDEIYRCVNFLSSDRTVYEGSIFYKSGSENPVIQFSADNQDDYSSVIDVFEKGEQAFAYIIEADGYGMATELHTINLTKGRETGVMDLSSCEIETFRDIAYNDEHDILFAETQEGLEAFLITDTEVKRHEFFDLEDSYSIEAWKVTGDGKKIFLCVRKGNIFSDEAREYLVLDTETGHFQQIEVEIETDFPAFTSGNISSRLCVQDGRLLHLIDCAEGKELSQITLTTAANTKMSFFRNEEILLVTYKNIVELYEVESGYLVESCTFETEDALQEVFRSTLEPITDSSGDYFALKENAYMADRKRSINSFPLIVFYIDNNMEIHKYAEVPYGYASLAAQEIATRAINSCYFTAFHDFSYLKKKAEEVLRGE